MAAKFDPQRQVRITKLWRKVTAEEWIAMFPARPPAFRKIARGLRNCGDDVTTLTAGGMEYGPWQPMAQLAAICRVSSRTLQRYLPVFESYGVIEIHRWRRRVDKALGCPSLSFRVFRGSAIPENWQYGGGNFPVSADQRAA